MVKYIDKREKILFLGNGINRLSGGVDWKGLMDELIKDTLESDKLVSGEKPLPLLYEEIVFKLCDKKHCDKISEEEKVLRGNIAKKVKPLTPNDSLKNFANLNVSHYLTTNYDYSIEKFISGSEGKRDNLSPERKFNLFRRRKALDKYIWHVHGEAENSSSITLGYDHYTGQLQKMRNYFTSGLPGRRRETGERLKSITIGTKNFEEFADKMMEIVQKGSIYSWMDLFMAYDVHIIGFSMDYTEIDLWWLIVHKEKERRRKKWLGKTFFHHINDRVRDKEKRNWRSQKEKISLLKSYGVNVINHLMKNKTYKEAYETIINNIKRY